MTAKDGGALTAGIVDGVDLIGGELLSFAFSIIAYVISPAGRAAATGAVTINLSLFAIVVLIFQIWQNFLIGLYAPDDFSLGFLIGDLVVLIFAAIVLWPIMPNAVIGMLIAFVMVYIGIIIKSSGIFGMGTAENVTAGKEPKVDVATEKGAVDEEIEKDKGIAERGALAGCSIMPT
jgi:hypothetical protein